MLKAIKKRPAEKYRLPESEAVASKQINFGRLDKGKKVWVNKPLKEIPHPTTDGHSHYWVNFSSSLWICKVCTLIVWMPVSWEEARGFSYDIDKLGFKKAYTKALNAHPEIKKALTKLNKAMESLHKDLEKGSDLDQLPS